MDLGSGQCLWLKALIRIGNCTPTHFVNGPIHQENTDTSARRGTNGFVKKGGERWTGNGFDFGEIWKVTSPVSSCTIKRVRHEVFPFP